MKKKSKQEVIDALYKEIERRDKIIDRLREENIILMKTALKKEEMRLEQEKS